MEKGGLIEKADSFFAWGLSECGNFRGCWKMRRSKKRTAKGAWYRAQGKATAQANVINVPFREPFALRLAP